MRPRFFLRRRFLFSFLPVACVAVLGAASLVHAGQVLGPFGEVVTLHGKTGSKRDFFEDDQVERLLLSHGIRTRITATGSRDVAISDLAGLDFVFPSGLPAARLVLDERRRSNQQARPFQPFVSPVVLATYREYAETLRGNGIATPQGGDDSLYYDLDMGRFVELIRDGATWNGIGIQRHGVANGNRVLAHSPSVCTANSAGTYLNMVAFAAEGALPTTEAEAERIATRIKPLLIGQGLPIADLVPLYLAPEGRGTAPIVVIYEHQYLAYQVRTADRTGRPDAERVLLYPTAGVHSQPEFISLTPAADRLAELITTDPALRRRAMELGFRVLDSSGPTDGPVLSEFLAGKGIPEPAAGRDDTRTPIPALPLVESMIKTVGECP